MADGSGAILASTLTSIDEIDADQWDHFANPDPQLHNPFISHAFLSALENSRSVSAEAGWAPMHLIAEDEGASIGVAPLYVKGHSQGEYVFDHHWADAYARGGGRYYPKLVCGVPFTPVPGPRLLAPTPAARAQLAAAIEAVVGKFNFSSAHVNFVSDQDRVILEAAGFLPRVGEQFHWFNRGYEIFDDFLAALSSRKRKTIRRERRQAVESGIIIRRLWGDEIEDRHWDAFWLFYQDTGARKWGQPYLTRDFFRIIAETMTDRLLLIVAEYNDEPIAGALNFIGGDALFGRYWGCLEDYPFLHFELCYYQAIDIAIERKLHRVEAGAQGQHKIARGYEPVATHSAHWIRNQQFRDAIASYLEAERYETGLEIDALKTYTPFKKG